MMKQILSGIVKFLNILILAFSNFQLGYAAEVITGLGKDEQPVDIIFYKKETFVVTEKGIYKKEKNQLVQKIDVKERINGAIIYLDTFYIATQIGLIKVDKNIYNSQNIVLPLTEKESNVSTIILDKTNEIWVGIEAYGVYVLKGNNLIKELGLFPINTAATTKDSAVWFGTNSGLHKLYKKKIIRYNEEGVANFEIPDNIVEKLYIDNISNLWVLMSNGISIFSYSKESTGQDDGGHEHLPSVKYIGSPGNAIYGISYIASAGYLFSTASGFLFLPSQEAHHLEEFEHGTSDKVEDKSSLYNCSLSTINLEKFNSKKNFITNDTKNNLWILNSLGLIILSTKDQKNLIARKI